MLTKLNAAMRSIGNRVQSLVKHLLGGFFCCDCDHINRKKASILAKALAKEFYKGRNLGERFGSISPNRKLWSVGRLMSDFEPEESQWFELANNLLSRFEPRDCIVSTVRAHNRIVPRVIYFCDLFWWYISGRWASFVRINKKKSITTSTIKREIDENMEN
jgi:hypothetical protein